MADKKHKIHQVLPEIYPKLMQTIGGVLYDGNGNTLIPKLINIPQYANDAAAIAGGLTTGQLYSLTVSGITQLCIVP
jgi:hypothetical protein